MSYKTKAAELSQDGYALTITGRNVHVTDTMKEYALEKISKIERFNIRIVDVIVTMEVHKLEHRVDIIVKVDHIKIKSQATSDDMYASIDKAVDRIQTQIRKYHDKIRDHQARGVSAIDMNVNVLHSLTEERLLDTNSEIEEETQRRTLDRYSPHSVVAKETRPLRLLTQEEAVMKMELSGDIFLIYRSQEDMKLKVIYRRTDKHYGVIELETSP
jgi:putative sigma-54 modulation protein